MNFDHPSEHIKLLLTVAEAAKILGFGRTFTYSLIASGAIQTVLIGRLRRVRLADLEAYTRNLNTSPIEKVAA